MVAEIDRRQLVDRHAVVLAAEDLAGIDGTSPLCVGNGELAHTVDITGTQTFPSHYPVPGKPPGTLLGTLSQWGWHSHPHWEQHELGSTRRRYRTPRGWVEYVDMAGPVALGDSGADQAGPRASAERWLRANPHRLDLARIALAMPDRAPLAREVSGIHQRLDLWTGVITSRFQLRGTPVLVRTACHPRADALAFRVESALLSAGLQLAISFPYGSESWGNAADWERPWAHDSVICCTGDGDSSLRVLRTVDATEYTVQIRVNGGQITRTGRHELAVTPAGPVTGPRSAPGTTLDVVVAFHPGHCSERRAEPSTADQILLASGRSWAEYWTGGGAVELIDSPDPRAAELERRVVLSQYLTAAQCAGSRPPQETGLMLNSWHGRFHLEMHWWHGAHFPLWGRSELLERSLGWYREILPVARRTAREQGYVGARWPKQVAPDGRESPSPIGPFLLWQQPHPIYLAELVRRAAPDPGPVLARYAEVVLESAAFMADVVAAGPEGYQLGPPLVPAQESYSAMRAEVVNPTFELAYWVWALRVASRWRSLLGLVPEPGWELVAAGMARPTVRDGRYAAIGVPPYTLLDDHPSMLYALGLVPETGVVDAERMRTTLHWAMENWPWETTWGWDYPAVAMTATRLGEPATALRALLMPTPKNRYLANGHNWQSPQLPGYLPGNGGLLSAIALMARGWDPGGRQGGQRHAPGFPGDGSWIVRAEGLFPLP